MSASAGFTRLSSALVPRHQERGGLDMDDHIMNPPFGSYYPIFILCPI